MVIPSANPATGEIAPLDSKRLRVRHLHASQLYSFKSLDEQEEAVHPARFEIGHELGSPQSQGKRHASWPAKKPTTSCTFR
jgi:hypothetical protein